MAAPTVTLTKLPDGRLDKEMASAFVERARASARLLLAELDQRFAAEFAQDQYSNGVRACFLTGLARECQQFSRETMALSLTLAIVSGDR